MNKNNILGNLSPKTFLQTHWQKKPLLIRNALPNFTGFLDKKSLIALSSQQEISSRLVQLDKNQWTLSYGPFAKRDFQRLTGKWALLVQGINQFLPEAEALLKLFRFIPHTRLDDLMVSFAPDGGGVGPHFDSYDVFLLQGPGKRVWQISKQKNRELIPDAPLRILKNFKAEQEWVLEPGDMLYLPPNYAHYGVAINDCITYSIGFRAASHQELIQQFLIYLQDHLQIDGIYTDPDLILAKHPAQISKDMVSKVADILKKIHFDKKDIENFLGNYLSEPKSNIFFESPRDPMSKIQFLNQVKKHGVCLDLKSQMLFTKNQYFINGEAYSFASVTRRDLQNLANKRQTKLTHQTIKQLDEQLYAWYLNGFIQLWKK